MYIKHQPWVSKCAPPMVADIEWNMWSYRAWPFNCVSENEEIAYECGHLIWPHFGRLSS